MYIDEMLEEAKRLFEEEKYIDSADLFERAAQESKKSNIVLQSMYGNNFVAYIFLDMGNYAGAIEYAERTINWGILCSQVEDVMNVCGEEILNNYRDACRYKGQAIFESDMSDDSCLTFLEEAEKYGDNEARYYLGLYYLMNNCEPAENINLYYDYCKKQAEYHEAYIENIGGIKEEDQEKISKLCDALAALYENGIGVPKDRRKAKYYKKFVK